MGNKARLILENGREFTGLRFGAGADGSPAGETEGEIVFTTGMTGYLETLTDPSYFGQIVVQTFPLIGNVGVIPSDFESERPVLRAYIVREWCQNPSNFRSEGVLDAFLKSTGIVGLYDIDTRALTRVLRESGVMNACVTSSDEDAAVIAARLRGRKITGAVEAVSPAAVEPAPAGDGPHVVLWDFGAKRNIRRKLERRGCRVTVAPAASTYEQLLALKPDGVMLSNGPGDPADNPGIIEQTGKLVRSGLPVFGICLGHQLIALAMGAKTEKLKYGHRGANQPVKELATGHVYITSQNHGYAVVPDSLPAGAEMTFVNANDGTSEGIRYTDRPVYSVQFHPEAAGGPLDTGFLFNDFISHMTAKGS